MAPPFTQPHIETSPKRVRVLFGGKYIVDTSEAKLVWLKPNYPTYFFRQEDVPAEYLQKEADDTSSDAKVYDVVVGSSRAKGAAKKHLAGALADLVEIIFGTMDAWFEEDEQIFVHPKDPYKRVEVLQSSRHVRVEVDGVVVAETTKPRLLFETSLPVRTYIPKTDCRMDLLTPSTLTTQCPYKGVANYYSINLPNDKTFENLVWWYRAPLLECAAVQGFVAFYDEKVDVFVNGVRVPRPSTQWS
ncbi:DUF427-domain-containing protein [Laetiporus sulphureus 93-53]|uniref:DUF427-domain-containing protein n=1 Tax=Laetiporus sulphureus 93-53 TaxID=1314785 RepID=A0A165CD14_9APHY|nr:DUF427-domain-containing protein [Laetiporus sulphureus 93-53]KZT02590.1 DUF427-domain-containing protein [Laetiporus sulphureus 93-53]